MPYRPQFAYPPPPEGWEDYEFEYYFDSVNTPALAVIPFNQIVLPLQSDAEFRLRAFEISGNTGNLLVRFWDTKGNQLSQVQVVNVLAYGSSVQGQPPGVLPVPLNDEIVCPPGSALKIDIANL